MEIPGKLYIVAVPIGNIEDITLRAARTLKDCDVLVCEERRQGSKLLKCLGIHRNDILLLNEHTEKTISEEVIQLLLDGKNAAVFSDCGTPVFSDPGAHLINKASRSGIQIIPIPGPSSLTAAISVLGFKLEKFVFGGFLPRSNAERQQELEKLKLLNMPVVLMDTPYRMVRLLEEIAKVYGQKQEITLACDMTQKTEEIYRGQVNVVLTNLKNQKSEFIVVIHNPENK